jgi:hypothetical protein
VTGTGVLPEEDARSGSGGGGGDGHSRSTLQAVVSGVAVAGLAGTIVFGALWAHERSKVDDQTAAARDTAAARQVASRFLLDLTNFGPKSLNADFSDMQAMATGKFATQVRQTLAPQLRSQLVAAQAQTQGKIDHLWVQSYAGSGASFFAEVTQTFRNNRSPAVHSDQLRVQVDLEKVAGRWKIAQVTTIGSGTPGAPAGG